MYVISLAILSCKDTILIVAANVHVVVFLTSRVWVWFVYVGLKCHVVWFSLQREILVFENISSTYTCTNWLNCENKGLYKNEKTKERNQQGIQEHALLQRKQWRPTDENKMCHSLLSWLHVQYSVMYTCMRVTKNAHRFLFSQLKKLRNDMHSSWGFFI